MLGSLTPPRTFLGVHFALFGFDPDTHRKVRGKLVSGGGVDAGQYGPNCTHVIVDKIVQDDPLCVAARNDGKTVVNGLWVDHSYDIGMTADTTSVLYTPLRGLNGIPGAENMIMCLTGYQRQDREDIMTMVAFMGAQFSKPLVANKVTHLICYKFEGEKYELAKKMKKIKLVNHKWLEDCLRDWEILPEEDYSKSSYELEMEVEAKDSEDEDQPMNNSRAKVISRSPNNLRVGTISPSVLLKSPKELAGITAAQEMPNVGAAICLKATTPIREFRELPVPGSDMATASGAASSDLHVECEKTHVSEKVIERHSLSYSRKGRLSVQKVDKSSRGINEVDVEINKSCSTAEQAKEGTSFASIQNPSPGSHVQKSGSTITLQQKRTLEDSSGISKSPKLSSHSTPSSSSSFLEIKRNEGSEALRQKRTLEASPGISKSPKLSSHSTPSNSSPFLESERKEGSEACNLVDQLLLSNSPNLGKSGHSVKGLNKYDALDKATPYASSSKIRNYNETSPVSSLPNTFCSGSRQDPFVKRHEMGETDLAVNELGEIGKEKTPQQAHENLSVQHQDQEHFGASSMAENSGLLDKDCAEDLPRKLVTTRKKTLGSRTKVFKSANSKGSIFSSKEDPPNKSPSSVKDKEDIVGVSDCSLSFANVGKVSLPPGNNEVAEAMNKDKTVDENQIGDNEVVEKIVDENLDDETQAPEEDCVTEKAVDDENPKHAENSGEAEEACLQNELNSPDLNEHDDARTPNARGLKGTKLLGKKSKKVVSDAKYTVQDPGIMGSDPTVSGDTKKGKQKKVGGNGKAKNPVVKAKKALECSKEAEKENKPVKKKLVSDAKDTVQDPEIVDCDPTTSGGTKKGKQKKVGGNGKAKNPVVKAKKTLECSKEAEKENKPVQNAILGETKSTLQGRKKLVKSNRQVKKVDAGKTSKLTGTQNGVGSKQPVWFIFSGHRPQRQKFRRIVRNLKGRFLRDSHNWSYQATHFIAPDPLRRTEKFFAAAASGRWILKQDYLTASSEAGKFLDEEPYEWHKNGLSEDGAINLEAPRKWRLLAERTGHGAFHDMRIIVYGECITPSLDTLKRVVKAGGGTILATSPPYSRFINSEVDFAVVSPGMPRVDIWVQEFLNHEIPCVAADYLVEYVCKVGYPLDKHVLYNTQIWAEKSFARLQKKAEEIIEPATPESKDLECHVCGSTDRGEEMLICGDESGGGGCGIGYHIDCLNPPLEAIPEDDWFCHRCCSESSNKSTPSAAGKKKKQIGSSSSKHKR